MLLYNLPIFTDGDANAFLAGVARANGFIKKVRSLPPTPSSAICAFSRSPVILDPYTEGRP